MAKGAGRNMLLKKGTDVVAGVRMLSLKFAATPIDVTDADSNGIITYLAAESASKQLTVEVSGLQDSNIFRALITGVNDDMLITDLSFTDPSRLAGSDILTGNFFMTSYDQTGNHDGAVEFTATFLSSGDWTFA